MSPEAQKTFYLEIFGCQMNVHDSEKVVGTLLAQGYRQVSTVEEAGLVLTTPVPFGIKPSKRFSPLSRLQKASQTGQALRRPGMRGSARRREDF